MITTNLSREEWALGIADAIAPASECVRRKVGAVVFDTNWRIIGAGYNGTRPGDSLSCARGDCPRGRHYRKACRWPGHEGADPAWETEMGCEIKCGCGNPWPCDQAVEPGSSYDTGPGACISTHAELNATSDVTDRMTGGLIAVSSAPCDGCIKILYNTTRLATLLWREGRHAF
jgi:dCMP deaminase